MSNEYYEGLEYKYTVKRNWDPENKHKDCFYFVLDITHDKHARKALKKYIKLCWKEHPVLAADLLGVLNGLQNPSI